MPFPVVITHTWTVWRKRKLLVSITDQHVVVATVILSAGGAAFGFRFYSLDEHLLLALSSFSLLSQVSVFSSLSISALHLHHPLLTALLLRSCNLITVNWQLVMKLP